MDPMPGANAATPTVCPVCHQPVLPSYYFCPNCGEKLQETPLPTSPEKQLQLYAFSLILPMICFLFVTRWQGFAYLRSKDEKAKEIGAVACSILVLSTIATFYYAYVWTEEAIQQSVNQINQEMSY